MTLSIFAASSLAPRLVGALGPRTVITAGMVTATAGMLLLSGVAPGGNYLANVLPGALLTAIGMGFSLVPATIVAMQGLPASQSGLGSGLLNTSRLMGGALGLAVLSTIADAQTKSHAALGAARALTEGFDTAFLVGSACTIAGALAAALLLRSRERADVPTPIDAANPAGVEERDGEALAA
jgi:MFS family permease